VPDFNARQNDFDRRTSDKRLRSGFRSQRRAVDGSRPVIQAVVQISGWRWDAPRARSSSDLLLSAKARVTSVVYPRRATLVAGDFFGALRDRVVVRLRFGCRGGSVDDVSASEAFSAVANAASPLIKSVQASS